MTRSQRHKLNQVTPSPAQAASATTSASVFTFPNVGTKKTKSRVFDSIPKGVVDLYPSKESTELHRFSTASPSTPHATFSCCSEGNVCSSKALSACYIQSYGKEYCQHMKDTETPIVPDPVSVIDDAAVSATTTTTTRRLRRSSGGPTTSHSSSSSNLLFEQDSDDCSSALAADASQETPARRRRVWGSTSLTTTSGLITAKKAVESSRFLDYQPDLTPKMRAILMDWIIELSEHFNFGHATLHLACTLVDQVLACGPLSFEDEEDEQLEQQQQQQLDNDGESKTNCFLISRDRFQLLGATCTWLACKMEELKPPQVSQIAYVSGTYLCAIVYRKKVEDRPKHQST